MTNRKGASTPGRATADLAEVSQLSERVLVTKWDKINAVVGKGGNARRDGLFLSSTGGTGAHKHAGILAIERARGPEATGRVPEGLPLGREVTVASRDAKEEGVVVDKVSRGEDLIGWLRGSMHFGEDLLWKGLGDPG